MTNTEIKNLKEAKMTNTEIKKRNIEEQGFSLGRGVRGKGYEVFKNDKLIGYFPIGKYDTDLDGQKDMIKDFLKKFNNQFIEDWDYDPYWDDYESFISFESYWNGTYWNGDYQCMHGGTTLSPSDCDYIDGRLNNYNDILVEDFWNFLDEKVEELEEIDPKGYVSVYHRKGKDWYVAPSLGFDEFTIYYKEEGEIEEAYFDDVAYSFYGKEINKIGKQIIQRIEDWKADLETQGYIYNQYILSDGYYNYDNEKTSYLANLLFDDIGEFYDAISEKIENWDEATIEEEFNKAFNTIINEKVRFNIDKSIEIKYKIWKEDKFIEETKNFNHLKILDRLSKKYNYKLIYNESYGSEAYAIKKDGEEYHFNIWEVIFKDNEGEESLREFIQETLFNIQKRKLYNLNDKELKEKAKRVFVGIQDSLASGNCRFGTMSFIDSHNIDISKIGGIRGDYLLDMELSNYTKRVVAYALMNKKEV